MKDELILIRKVVLIVSNDVYEELIKFLNIHYLI